MVQTHRILQTGSNKEVFLMAVTVTKKFDFCYGHFLPGYSGDCKNQHGHNSTVEIEIGENQDHVYNGMIIDFKEIKKQVGPIIAELDHTNLNDVIEIPTAENICRHIARQIQARCSFGMALVRVRVSETADSFAEWRR
jgi:6-pyruvoyltetrahydropterin/6-carboxytetrahydropterin synthase